jgi:hypothetical protein
MKALPILFLVAVFLLPGCNTTHTVKVEPIKVEKVEIEMNINLKVDKKLDDFFDFEEEFEGGGD